VTHQPSIDFGISSAQQVYDWLRDLILRGALAPGARLSETEIGNRIGVSRQPVREAFIRLAADGLAEVRPQRGTYISRISISAVLSARLIREAVESDLIRMVAENPEPDLIPRLDAEIEHQRRAIARDNAEEFVKLDDRFHHMLAVAAGQDAVWSVLEGLKSQMNRLRYITARTFDAQKLLDQHAGIVDGLRRNDPDAAEQAMRLHLRELLNDMPEISASRADLFIP